MFVYVIDHGWKFLGFLVFICLGLGKKMLDTK